MQDNKTEAHMYEIQQKYDTLLWDLCHALYISASQV